MSDLLQMFMLHYGQIYFVTICFRPEQQELELHTRMDLIMCSSFLADLQLMVHVKAILPY
jgi:hypothetical protein